MMLILLILLIGFAFVLLVISFIQNCTAFAHDPIREAGCVFFCVCAVAMIMDYCQNNKTPLTDGGQSEDAEQGGSGRRGRSSRSSKSTTGKGRMRYKGCGCGKCLWQVVSVLAVVFFLGIMIADAWYACIFSRMYYK